MARVNISRLSSREEFEIWARRTFTSRRFTSEVVFFVDTPVGPELDAEVLVTSESNFKNVDWGEVGERYPYGSYGGRDYGFALNCAPKVWGVSAFPLDVLRENGGIRIVPGVEVGVMKLRDLVQLHNCQDLRESEAPCVRIYGWDIPIQEGCAARDGAVAEALKGLEEQRKPAVRYYERMGLSPRELFQVTPATVNQGTLLYGNVDHHDSPLGAALAILDRDLSLKMAKKFLAWGANAADQHPNRNPYVGKDCPMEMARMVHGRDEAYMAEIVPLLVKNGAEPPKEKTPAAGDCAPDGK